MAYKPSMMHFLAFKMIIPRDGTRYGCHCGVLGFDHMVRIRPYIELFDFCILSSGLYSGVRISSA
jgi:hypothetical protein